MSTSPRPQPRAISNDFPRRSTSWTRIRVAGVENGLPFDHSADSLAGVQTWNLTTRYGDLDLSFVPSGTRGYGDLTRDSRQIELFGVRVQVASLADIVRSKQAANRPKDQRVLPTLRELLAGERSPGEHPGAVT